MIPAQANVAPLTELEWALVQKLSNVRFPPYTASKRFAHSLADDHIQKLSDRGRGFLAFIVHRFRRQISLTPEQQQWVTEWKSRYDANRQEAPISNGVAARGSSDADKGGAPERAQLRLGLAAG